MPITDIAVTDIANFADGHEFGAAGAYVRITGVARGMLYPAAPAHAGIVDLDKAPTNPRGLVDYATDFDILRPKDAPRGSGILGWRACAASPIQLCGRLRMVATGTAGSAVR